MKNSKKEQFNKITELIYSTSLKLDFRFDLSKIKAKFNIKTEGFESDEERNSWYKSLSKEEKDDYWEDSYNLFKKYNLPTISRFLIDYYICRDKLPTNSPKSLLFNTCELDFDAISYLEQSPIDKKWRNGNQPFIKLYISDLASKEEVKYFIDKNWKNIKENLGFQWAGNRRVIRPRKEEDKKIQEEIYFLSIRPREMLGAKKGEYKEALIAKIINNKYNKNYSRENIRQIIVRQRKLRKSDTP